MATRTRAILKAVRNGVLAVLVAVNISSCALDEWRRYSSTPTPTATNIAVFQEHGQPLYTRPALVRWHDRLIVALFVLWPAFVLAYVVSSRAAKASATTGAAPMGR